MGRLESVSSLTTKESIRTLVDVCSLIFERAAQYSYTVATLGTLLSQAGCSAASVAVFQEVWRLEGPVLNNACKERNLGAPGHSQLADVQWRLHLKVASESSSQICEPSAILQFSLRTQEKVKASQVQRDLVLNMSYDELLNMYEQLEQAQEQLDQLS
eukprot:c19067_g1_i2 orf=360-833(+)